MQIFPELLETQVLLEMENAQNRFARLTRILEKIGDLQSLTSQVSWAVPSEFVELYEVELYDSDSKSLNKVNENINWVLDNNRLIFYATSLDTDGSTITKITSIPTSINSILVRYSHLPAALTARTIALELDNPDFTPAVMYGALATLYGRIKQSLGIDREGNAVLGIDRNTRDYWEVKFKEQVIEAKRYINSQDSTESEAVNYRDPGMTILPKEASDANLSKTNWS